MQLQSKFNFQQKINACVLYTRMFTGFYFKYYCVERYKYIVFKYKLLVYNSFVDLDCYKHVEI